ncbi:hypothetical protein NU10_06470 [Flavobacterium dauae]|uniref:hypothetical protein n=1 Tax=Flavobacterium dauae TaxID=1563479 RepID=UPI00101B495C|nr:hypothetical protein [Flavobacterium dauae]WLD25009.1 hypothetical protein NU10_06470 [Flavobacterium dauae]
MKKTLLLALTPLLFTSCQKDYYEGDERIIVEGKVVYNNIPLSNAEVNVYPVYNKPVNGSISEVYYNDIFFGDNKNNISKSFTDNSGKLSLSIPRNEDTTVYVVEINYGNTTKYYGYVSRYNAGKFYVNLGTITF